MMSLPVDSIHQLLNFIRAYFATNSHTCFSMQSTRNDILSNNPSWIYLIHFLPSILSNGPCLPVVQARNTVAFLKMHCFQMRYSVLVATWVISDERHLGYQKSSQSCILDWLCHYRPLLLLVSKYPMGGN